MDNFFVAGIDTGVGKTFFSAVLVNAFDMDYWKPIQAGNLDETDSMFIQEHSENIEIFPESYRLKMPASPHVAASFENIDIVLDKIHLPVSKRAMVVEGAGGVLVPLNNQHYIIDLIKKLGLKVILVVKNYLGCINHTLLTIEALQSRNIEISGWVLNGEENPFIEESIAARTSVPLLLKVKNENHIDYSIIKQYAKILKENEKLLRTRQ